VIRYVGILALVSFLIWIWALVDVLRTPDESMFQTGNRLIWVIVIVFTYVVGALIYWAIGKPVRRR
jgi:hypothetical protein